MNTVKLKALLLVLTFAVAAFGVCLTSASAGLSIGQKAPNFSAPDAVTNDDVSLQSLLSTNKAVVLIFVSTQCPYSNGYNTRMQALFTKYAPLGVAVVGVNSNANETDQMVTEHKWEHHLTFQIIKDVNNVVADKYGATHTPEAYVINATGILAYHGRIDNSVELPKVTSHDLADAIDDVLAGKPVLVAETKAFGCSIKRVGM
jgi:peroxiredoxin